MVTYYTVNCETFAALLYRFFYDFVGWRDLPSASFPQLIHSPRNISSLDMAQSGVEMNFG